MSEQHCLHRRAYEPFRKHCGHVIAEVSEIPHYTPFERLGIIPAAQHLDVVVRLDEHRFALADVVVDPDRRLAHIGRDAHLSPAFQSERIAERIYRVMRDAERQHFYVSDRKPVFVIFRLGVTVQLSLAAEDRLRRLRMRIDASILSHFRERRNVIRMFMGHDDTVKFRGRKPEPAQRLVYTSIGHPRVHQDRRCVRKHQSRVPLAAARKRHYAE